MNNYFKHKTAEVSAKAKIGNGTKIWHYVQVMENAIIGEDCILGKNVYIDSGVNIGNKVKIQNNVSVYKGVNIENNVFIGPHVCFTNDKMPRATDYQTGALKTNSDWKISNTVIKSGASIGANSTILPGITIGSMAMIGAGSVVTKDIPDFALAYGSPVKVHGLLDKSGTIIIERYK